MVYNRGRDGRGRNYYRKLGQHVTRVEHTYGAAQEHYNNAPRIQRRDGSWKNMQVGERINHARKKAGHGYEDWKGNDGAWHNKMEDEALHFMGNRFNKPETFAVPRNPNVNFISRSPSPNPVMDYSSEDERAKRHGRSRRSTSAAVSFDSLGSKSRSGSSPGMRPRPFNEHSMTKREHKKKQMKYRRQRKMHAKTRKIRRRLLASSRKPKKWSHAHTSGLIRKYKGY